MDQNVYTTLYVYFFFLVKMYLSKLCIGRIFDGIQKYWVPPAACAFALLLTYSKLNTAFKGPYSFT